MFSEDDFVVESFGDLLELLPILPFIGLVAPVLIGWYTLGFIQDRIGWLDT